jgi:hypothetical protein
MFQDSFFLQIFAPKTGFYALSLVRNISSGVGHIYTPWITVSAVSITKMLKEVCEPKFENLLKNMKETSGFFFVLTFIKGIPGRKEV